MAEARGSCSYRLLPQITPALSSANNSNITNRPYANYCQISFQFRPSPPNRCASLQAFCVITAHVATPAVCRVSRDSRA